MVSYSQKLQDARQNLEIVQSQLATQPDLDSAGTNAYGRDQEMEQNRGKSAHEEVNDKLDNQQRCKYQVFPCTDEHKKQQEHYHFYS